MPARPGHNSCLVVTVNHSGLLSKPIALKKQSKHLCFPFRSWRFFVVVPERSTAQIWNQPPKFYSFLLIWIGMESHWRMLGCHICFPHYQAIPEFFLDLLHPVCVRNTDTYEKNPLAPANSVVDVITCSKQMVYKHAAFHSSDLHQSSPFC